MLRIRKLKKLCVFGVYSSTNEIDISNFYNSQRVAKYMCLIKKKHILN